MPTFLPRIFLFLCRASHVNLAELAVIWTHDRCVKGMGLFSWISHDVTAAMLVSPNNEMPAVLVSRSNPPGIESYYYANVFFCFR